MASRFCAAESAEIVFMGILAAWGGGAGRILMAQLTARKPRESRIGSRSRGTLKCGDNIGRVGSRFEADGPDLGPNKCSSTLG